MQKVLKLLPLLFLVVVAIASALFGYSDNPIKAIAIVAFILLWIGIFLIKDALVASIILILLTLPFTISFQLGFWDELGFVNGLYVNYLIPTIYLLDIFILALLLSTIPLIKRFRVTKKVIISFTFIILFWLIHNLSKIELGVFISSTRYLVYILSFLFLYLCREKLYLLFYQKKNLLISIIIFSLFFQLVVAILQVSSGSNIGIDWLGESVVSAGNVNASTLNLDGRLFLRGYGTFPHPNLLAGYGVFIFTIFLTLYRPFHIIGKRLVLFFSVLTFLVILLTLSHGGLIAFFSILLIFFLYLVYIKYFKRRTFSSRRNFPTVFIFMDRSLNERIDLIRSSWDYFLDNIFFGVGSGNFLKDFYTYAPRSDDGLTLMQPVHNIFILIMVEYGIFGGLLINILLAMYFLYQFLVRRYKVVVLLVAVYLLILGSVDHYLITLPQGFFLFLSSLFFVGITD